MIETVRPTKPKILIIWLFTEKFSDPCKIDIIICEVSADTSAVKEIKCKENQVIVFAS